MNVTSKFGGMVVGLGVGSLMIAAASPALATHYVLCDGYSNNNRATVAGATCNAPVQADCWEDFENSPPDWDEGYTFAGAQYRVCSGEAQIRAYAYGNLNWYEWQTGFYALTDALDGFGNQIPGAYTIDSTANGAWSSWVNVVSGATFIRSRGFVYDD